MTVLCDFTVIQEGEVRIGDNSAGAVPDTDGSPMFQKTFKTTKRHNTHALLMMNVFGLTDSSAEIRINGQWVKPLDRGKHNQWFSQHIVVRPNVLKASDLNTLEIKRALETDPNELSKGKKYDDFIVRDIVIFFHQHDD
jgi:hypothetical protein